MDVCVCVTDSSICEGCYFSCIWHWLQVPSSGIHNFPPSWIIAWICCWWRTVGQGLGNKFTSLPVYQYKLSFNLNPIHHPCSEKILLSKLIYTIQIDLYSCIFVIVVIKFRASIKTSASDAAEYLPKPCSGVVCQMPLRPLHYRFWRPVETAMAATLLEARVSWGHPSLHE